MNRASESNRPDDRHFQESLRELLRESEKTVDFIAASRLGAARARAVEAAAATALPRSGWWTVPGAAVTALALAWLLVTGRILTPWAGSGNAAAVPQVEVIETLADDKTTGVYDDLEFYQWLADTDGHG